MNEEKIVIFVINNTGVWPGYFCLDLINLYMTTLNEYPNTKIQTIHANSVNEMRNFSCRYAMGKRTPNGETPERFDYLVQLDSVTPETPLFIKRNGRIDFVEISELFKENNTITDNNGNKIYSHIPKNIEIYTKNGWKKICNVMKHHVKKPIYHIDGDCVTRTTGDHSLFKCGNEIKPSELKSGDIVDKIPFNKETKHSSIVPKLAELYGFFCAEGTCGKRKSSSNKKTGTQWYNYQWNITGNDKSALEEYKDVLEGYFCRPFKIEVNSKGGEINTCYRLVPTGERKDIAEFFRKEFYTESKLKKVPQIILNSNKQIIKAFLEGYIKGDGHIYKDGSKQYSTNSYILSAGLNFLYNYLGKNTRHFVRKDKPTIITTKINNTNRKYKHGIGKKIIYGDYEGDVYDICTEDGTFVGGVGNVLFKNTDHRYNPEFIIDLMKHKKDVVTGCTSNRKAPFKQTQFKKFQKELRAEENIANPKPDEELMKIEASGPVGMIIKVDVLDKLKYPYYIIKHIGTEEEGNLESVMGGDIYFTKQLNEAGIELWLDPSITFPHEVSNVMVNRGQLQL